MTDAARPRAGWQRFIPLIVLVLCILPPAAAWLLANGAFGWKPAHLTVSGDLLEPPPTLELAGVHGIDGVAQPFPSGPGIWTLAYIGGPECDAACEAALERLRSAQLATGKRVIFVQRMYVHPEGVRRPIPAAMAAAPAGLLAPVAASDWPAIQALLGGAPAAVVIVDPHGRAVLRYPPQFPFKGLVDDVKRLLGVPAR
ncbi:MAG: hypothetical protein AB7Q97_11380 [Gammaproteobacteria bacterium]